MVENYSIKSRSHVCHVTGEAFAEEQPFIAAIFPDPESSGYLRRDYSIAAWENIEEGEEKPFSFWRSLYKPPVKEEKAEVTPHDPESLFAKLVEDDEGHTENARFILAAMLERKKILRETDTQQLPSGLLRVYENRKTGDVFIVKDPQIALSDVESIQDEVQQLLDPERYAALHQKSEEEAASEDETPATETDSAEVSEENPDSEEPADTDSPQVESAADLQNEEEESEEENRPRDRERSFRFRRRKRETKTRNQPHQKARKRKKFPAKVSLFILTGESPFVGQTVRQE